MPFYLAILKHGSSTPTLASSGHTKIHQAPIPFSSPHDQNLKELHARLLKRNHQAQILNSDEPPTPEALLRAFNLNPTPNPTTISEEPEAPRTRRKRQDRGDPFSTEESEEAK